MAQTRTAIGLFGKGIHNKESALTPAELYFPRAHSECYRSDTQCLRGIYGM